MAGACRSQCVRLLSGRGSAPINVSGKVVTCIVYVITLWDSQLPANTIKYLLFGCWTMEAWIIMLEHMGA
jgi:hypothetical protein